MSAAAYETPFTRAFGCRHPVQMAGMAGVGGPALCAAVSDAGGLGMLSATEPELDAAIAQVRERTAGPFGVNVLMPFLDVAAVEVAARAAQLVEFFYADPDPTLVKRARDAGAPHVGWQVGSAREAELALEAGCDFVVAQGVEAGGHVRGTTPVDALLPEVLAIAPPSVIVVTAGGVVDASGAARLIAAGAHAVRIGTRFLTAHEADVHPAYIDALLAAAGPDDTVLTEKFGVGWPDAPHRVLASAVTAAAEASEAGGEPVATLDGDELPLWSVIPPVEAAQGRIEAMALYAGMGVGTLHTREPAAAIVRDIGEGAAAQLAAGR